MNGNIDDLIESKIDNIISKNNIYHVGKVVRINSFIVEAAGLDDAFFFEKVFIGDENNIGYVDKIEENKVVIALVKTDGNIKIGDSIKTTGEALQANFSKNSMGMIIDAFGTDRMSGKNFNDSKMIPIETAKIPIMERTSVNRPMETGIAGIDLMFPIGKGQRQLIIGDKKTGKTQICLDTIVNQKGKDVICIYVSIGKTKKEIKRLYTKLIEKGANSYTQIVAAFNDDTSPLIKLTPYVGLSIAEEYMREGKDVLVCIDDLKKHADACREIALIAEKNTGREAYPADIFYTHSRLLEKGCQYHNGGSITILPIVETKGGDITDYISTNIISITDGQIVLSDKLFKKGQKPAINFGLSVSRLGGAVQKPNIKKVGAVVRRELLSYLETADVYQLVKIDSMSKDLQEKILLGKKLLKLLNQPKFAPLSEEKLIENFGFVLNDGTPEPEIKDEDNGSDDVDSTNDNNVSNGNENIVAEVPEVTEPIVEEPKTEEQTEIVNEEIPTENNENIVAEVPEATEPVVEEPKIEEQTELVSEEVTAENNENIVAEVPEVTEPVVEEPKTEEQTELINEEIPPENNENIVPEVSEVTEPVDEDSIIDATEIPDVAEVTEIEDENPIFEDEVPEEVIVEEPIVEVTEIPDVAEVTEIEDENPIFEDEVPEEVVVEEPIVDVTEVGDIDVKLDDKNTNGDNSFDEVVLVKTNNIPNINETQKEELDEDFFDDFFGSDDVIIEEPHVKLSNIPDSSELKVTEEDIIAARNEIANNNLEEITFGGNNDIISTVDNNTTQDVEDNIQEVFDLTNEIPDEVEALFEFKELNNDSEQIEEVLDLTGELTNSNTDQLFMEEIKEG